MGDLECDKEEEFKPSTCCGFRTMCCFWVTLALVIILTGTAVIFKQQILKVLGFSEKESDPNDSTLKTNGEIDSKLKSCESGKQADLSETIEDDRSHKSTGGNGKGTKTQQSHSNSRTVRTLRDAESIAAQAGAARAI